MKWRFVGLDRGLVHVEERYYRGDTDIPKTERSKRILPLGQLVTEYRERKQVGTVEDAYVFEKDGDPMDDRAILRDYIRPAAKKLGFHFEVSSYALDSCSPKQ